MIIWLTAVDGSAVSVQSTRLIVSTRGFAHVGSGRERIVGGHAVVSRAHVVCVGVGGAIGLLPANALCHLVIGGSEVVSPAMLSCIVGHFVVEGEERVALLQCVRLVARPLCNRPAKAQADACHTTRRIKVGGPLMTLSRRAVSILFARGSIDGEAICVVGAHAVVAHERAEAKLVGGVAVGLFRAKVALNARPPADAMAQQVGRICIGLLVTDGKAVIVSALVILGADLPVTRTHVVAIVVVKGRFIENE